MKTKFTEMMEWFNAIINKQEHGSERYREIIEEKYKFIKEY